MDFGETWLEMWKKTDNYQLWLKNTDSHLFDIVDPRHPTAGSLSLEDINRRLAQQIEELNLEERFNVSKEVLNRHLTSGKKHVFEVWSKARADFEAYRTIPRNQSPISTTRTKEMDDSMPPPPATAPLPSANSTSPSHLSHSSQSSTATQTPTSATAFLDTASIRVRAPDMSSAHAVVGAAGQRASAYFSSWGSWATEKRKGWSSTTSGTPTTPNYADISSTSNQPEKKDTRNPRKLLIVERMRHADTSSESKSSWSAPPTATTYNPFSRSASHRNSALRSSPVPVRRDSEKTQRSSSITSTSPTDNPSSTTTTTTPTTIHQEQPPPSSPPQSAVEPRSPGPKRGIGKGKRREEKGSDGIGRLDA